MNKCVFCGKPTEGNCVCPRRMKQKVIHGIQKFLVYWLIAAGFLATYLAIGIIIGFSFTASLLWSCYALAMISEVLFFTWILR